MKRLVLILISGLALAIIGFVVTYFSMTGHSLKKGPTPELAWLRQEYQLNDEQYTRICRLYAAYHPKCLEMCRQIDEQNARLKTLLTATNTVTPEIKQALAQTAQLRAKCEAMMLDHFYEVSHTMPPQQGERYLAWVQKETLIPSPQTNR